MNLEAFETFKASNRSPEPRWLVDEAIPGDSLLFFYRRLAAAGPKPWLMQTYPGGWDDMGNAPLTNQDSIQLLNCS